MLGRWSTTSCYFRHIGDILEEAGITVTKANKKQVDEAIHRAVGVGYKECPAAWKRVKEHIRGDEEKRQALVSRLRAAGL